MKRFGSSAYGHVSTHVSIPLQISSEVVHGLPLVILGEVAVPAGHRRTLVPQDFLEREHVATGHEEVRCEGVASVVEIEVLYAEGGEVGDITPDVVLFRVDP